jgi:type II secretory pathway pseudopilin PulG
VSDIFLHIDGQQSGPYPPAQVRQFLAEKRISAETLAWHEGLSAWAPVGTVLAAFPPASVPPPVMPPPAPAMPPIPAKKKMSGCLLAFLIAIGALIVAIPVLSCLAGLALGPITVGIKKAKESASMQTSRAIALAMFQYADDHNGAYPDGKTSTEVFQKLLDGKYISDPGLFYLEMPGKTKATSSTLTAENVSYDVTWGVTSSSSGSTPLVFCTGYIVTYTAGASAARDSTSPTPFPGPDRLLAGLAVAYKDNNARFLQGDETVPNFVPPDFDAGTVTHHQLKP